MLKPAELYTHTHTHTQLKRCQDFLCKMCLFAVLVFTPNFSFATTLPSGYTQLEYIESTGTQHIDTGYYTNANTWVSADIMSLVSGNKNWFGGDANRDAFVFNIYTNHSKGSRFEYKFGGDWWLTFPYDNIPNNRYLIDFNKNGKIYVNHEEQARLSTTGTNSKTLLLFARQGGTAKIRGRIYSFKIYENESDLKRNLIPARRDSDNVVGLYDTVNDVFYTNSGSGTFIAGPETSLLSTIVHINWGGVELDSDDPARTCTYGESLTVPNVTPTPPMGYKFLGWIPQQ